MRYLVLFFLFAAVNLHAQKDPADTLLIKRARYFGVYAGVTQFMQPGYVFYENNPYPDDREQILRYGFKRAFRTGLFFTYPFLHKMEWEVGLGAVAYQSEVTKALVTNYTNGPGAMVVSYHSWNLTEFNTVFEARTICNYELRRRENSALLVGGGLMYSGKADEANNGIMGAEIKVTFYQRAGKKSFLQYQLSPGWMIHGHFYINAGIAFCYEGHRTMRAHPKHYYVRTYEPGE